MACACCMYPSVSSANGILGREWPAAKRPMAVRAFGSCNGISRPAGAGSTLGRGERAARAAGGDGSKEGL